jgi:DNA-binding Lrp family transcriptional regulator
MLAEERRFRIREILLNQRTISAAELRDILGVTAATIRRDLGALEDEGGNRIHFKFSPPMSADSPNLHSFWDNATVNIAFANDDDSNANELASSEPASWQLPSSVVVEDWPKAWANEILSVAKAAHTPIVFQGMHTTHNGEHIFQAKIDSNTYPPMAGAAVRKAIHKAGWRLAALLEAALQE